jgi:hypothetical protein
MGAFMGELEKKSSQSIAGIEPSTDTASAISRAVLPLTALAKLD